MTMTKNAFTGAKAALLSVAVLAAGAMSIPADAASITPHTGDSPYVVGGQEATNPTYVQLSFTTRPALLHHPWEAWHLRLHR